MKKRLSKMIHTIIIIFCLFLAFAACLLFNRLLEYKLQKQEVQSVQTIYDALYPTEEETSQK